MMKKRHLLLGLAMVLMSTVVLAQDLVLYHIDDATVAPKALRNVCLLYTSDAADE